jgi:hypothetical protein
MHACFLFVAFLIFWATSLVFAPRAGAQYVANTLAAQHHGSASLPVGGTLLQDVGNIAVISGCTTSTSTCTFGILPVTAGSVGVIFTYTGNNLHISSATITGGTFSACPAGGSFNELCNAYNATGGSVDAIYETGHTAGTEQVTVTLSGTPTSYFAAEFVEIAPPPGYSFAGLDASGSLIQTSCTSCTGVALTTTETDSIIQGAFQAAQFVNAWNSVSSPYLITHANSIFAPNVSAGSLAAPTLTMAAAGAVPFSALAFKTSAGNYTVATPLFSLVNFTFVTDAGNLNCTPTCSITIPSTTAGNLIFVAAAATTATASISATDGGDTFTNCSGANITVTGQAEALSCTYAVTAGGKTTVSITMSSNASTGVGVFEVSRTGGSWTLDAQGSTQRAAPGGGPVLFTGQALSLTGSNDACFQGFFNTGGAITVQNYPFAYTTGANGGTYILNTQASEVFLPGTYYGAGAGTGAAPIWITNQNLASAVNGVCFK